MAMPDIPRGANIIERRFELELKIFSITEEMAKERYMSQHFSDSLKDMIARDAITL